MGTQTSATAVKARLGLPLPSSLTLVRERIWPPWLSRSKAPPTSGIMIPFRLSLLFLLGFLPPAASVNVSLSDMAVLQSLSEAWNLPFWNSSTDCSNSAIMCDSDRVISLNLSSYKLTRSIPQSIGNLSALTSLDLSSNELTGSIPNSIGDLAQLAFLVLSNNQLNGSIPESLGNHLYLQDIYLNNNELVGSIPQSFNSLVQLHNLVLSSNNLSGSIPDNIALNSYVGILDLSSNHLTGSIPGSLGNLKALTNLNLGSNQLTGSIPDTIGSRINLTNLDLSSNQLTGSIQVIAELSALQNLNLSSNGLTGSIPDAVGNFSALRTLDLSHNKLSGTVPPSIGELSSTSNLSYNFFTNASSVGGSVNIAQNCIPNATDQRSTSDCSCQAGTSCTQAHHGKSSSLPAILGAVGGLVACAVIAAAVAFYCLTVRHRKRGYRFDKEMEALTLQKYSRRQILAATANFSEAIIIGKGGYGTVYLAKAPDGTPWAVKRANLATQNTLSVFENEVHLISTLRHPNLVALLGYHSQGDEQVLVYEYVPNGTLYDHIFSKAIGTQQGMLPLSFDQRLEIMVGMARGLNYLHTFLADPIVHRDVKSSNVLLDENLQAKVSDFGLTKSMRGVDHDEQVLFQSSSASQNPLVVGTPGYIDPEYYSSVTVTEKSDVYSFGVVMLELLTGKPAVMYDPETAETVGLARWASSYLVAGKFESILDPELEAGVEKFRVVASVASMCIAPLGKDRPSMAQVTRYLEAAQGSTLLFDPAKGADSSVTWDSIDMSVNEILAGDSSKSSAFMRAPLSQAITGR